MISWIVHIIFIILFIFIYLHIYLHFRVSNENELITLNDVCKKEITDHIYYKQPFVFDGTSIQHKINLDEETKTTFKGYDVYKLIYEPVKLLEPTVKFFPSVSAYSIRKKNKFIDVETNLECRNFYRVQKGKAKFICIHPKYSEHFINHKNIDFIKNNENMIHVELEENKILFLPNYWHVSFESLEKDTLIEKIKYKTILNQINFIW